MRLTKAIKEDFVRRVLEDVPQVNYNKAFDELVQAEAYSKLPEEIKTIYGDEKLRAFLRKESVWGDCLGYTYVISDDFRKSPQLVEQLEVLTKQSEEQIKKSKELRITLENLIECFTTVKKARDAMPEFSKYLPLENEPAPKFLPATDISKVVTKLIENGWKGTKEKK